MNELLETLIDLLEMESELCSQTEEISEKCKDENFTETTCEWEDVL